MAKALRNYVNRTIPQTEKAKSNQVKNNAGGYAFEVSDKMRLERFLILGTDGGTYYVKEMDLTKQNVDFLRRMIKANESLVLETTVEISKSGRAYRNDAAIFVLALLLAEGKNKSATVDAVSDVIRTGTHVYALADFITSLGGWGRSKRAAVAKWFTGQSSESLAYQAVKYRQRNGWTMRDLMCKSHPKGVDSEVGNFILGVETLPMIRPEIIAAFESMQKQTTIKGVLDVLSIYPNLPWETIPTQFLKEPKVWRKLFENGQLRGQALVRNVVRLAKLDMFKDMHFAKQYADALRNEDMIRKTRLHPMQYLNAYWVYDIGQIDHKHSGGWSLVRNKTWATHPIIQDGLDDGFGLSFGNIEPSNKRMMLSLDVSGSMNSFVAGSSDLTARQASAAMALITARVEPYYVVNGFSTTLTPLNITARDTIKSAVNAVSFLPFGGTDCAQPMLYAARNNLDIDAFVVITDNETWAGSIHPHEALKRYRQKTGIDARLVVMGMSANEFSIADPLDSGMLDVVGFDSNTPKVVSDFSAGRI